MFAKLVVLVGLVGYASAICQCATKLSTQKEAWQNASVVAHVKIDKVNRAGFGGGLGSGLNLNNGQNSRQNGQSNQNQNEVTYEITYAEVFKPKGSSNSSLPKTITTPSTIAECGVPFLAQNSEYLIAGQRNGENLEVTTCSSFPFMDNGIPTGPTLWSAVSPDLKEKLKNGSF